MRKIMKKKTITLKKWTVFDIVNTVFVIFVTLIILYPLYFCVIASFSNPTEVALGKTLLWVKDFTAMSYELILEEKLLLIGYRNTIFYTICGTAYNVALTIPAAYVLSKKEIPYHGFLSWFFFITMYVSGGMIPSYILVKNLGLLNTPWVMIIGSGVSVYNMIVVRSYFSSTIPASLYDAAFIDGATEFQVFTRIAIPLSKAIIAVISLFYAVGHWNNFYTALIYIYDKNLYPLQLVLRNLLINGQLNLSSNIQYTAEELKYMVQRARIIQTMKYSIVVVAAIPLLIVYPFIQKYFVKGVMIGSVKG